MNATVARSDPMPRANRVRGIRLAVIGLAALLLAAAPKYADSEALLIIQQVVVVTILALSVDILDGFAGLPTLGQAAYAGISAYTIALLVTKSSFDNFLALSLLGLLVSCAAAALFGLAALRTRSVYFLLVTFALGELLATAASQYESLSTPGVEGIVGVTFTNIVPGIPWTTNTVYLYSLACAALCCVLYWLLARSSFGYSLLATREGLSRARALGINSWQVSFVAFIFAGLIAGVAGEVKVATTSAAVPTDFGVVVSAEALLVVIIGGSRRLTGIISGAVAVVVITYYASLWFPVRWPLVIGLLYLAAAFLALKGGVSGLTARWTSAANREPGAAP